MSWLKSNLGTIVIVLIVLAAVTYAARKFPAVAKVYPA